MARKRRIFIVEDHPATAEAVKQFLEFRGYRVDVAVDVKSAVRYASAERFDVMVSDLHLPDGTGWELIKKLPRQSRVRAIAFSAFDAPEDRRRSKEAGFDEHIGKGQDPDLLIEAIEGTA